MSRLLDGLLPDQQTKMFDEVSERGMRATPPGMAHWAGGGPQGKTCRECKFYTDEGRYTANSKKHASGQLKPGSCKKHRAITKSQQMTRSGGTKSPKFAWTMAACKYFEQHPNPPVAVERKYGNLGH